MSYSKLILILTIFTIIYYLILYYKVFKKEKKEEGGNKSKNIKSKLFMIEESKEVEQTIDQILTTKNIPDELEKELNELFR